MGTNEIKRVDLSWCEKCDLTENEVGYLEELLRIDRDLAECDNILSEVNLQTGYVRYEQRIYDIAEKRRHLWDFIIALPQYIGAHLDDPLYQAFKKASEAIKQIRMNDFKVENTLGLRIVPLFSEDNYGKHHKKNPQREDSSTENLPGFNVTAGGKGDYGGRLVKQWLTLEDFIGNVVGDLTTEGHVLGTNRDCVEEFAAFFSEQYESMVVRGVLVGKRICQEAPGSLIQQYEKEIIQGLPNGEISQADYLDQISVWGEEVYPPTFGQLLASNLLDLTIVKPIWESCCGYNLITKEKLTEFERKLNVVFAALDLLTLASGISEFARAAGTIGVKEAASYLGKQFLVEMSADASATAMAAIGEKEEWPAWLTMALSFITGTAVGSMGNLAVFDGDKIRDFLRRGKKIGAEGGSAADDAIEAVRRSDDVVEEGLETTRQLEKGKTTLKYNEVNLFTAEETNQWFVDNVNPDYKPPYKPGTVVKEIELTENTIFVRVYDNMPDGSGMYGSWVMRAEDIEGLTPLEIQDKFALPNTPKYICDVELEAGTHIRVGEVNPLEGWGSGGGTQYDLIGQRIGDFKNERLLEGY